MLSDDPALTTRIENKLARNPVRLVVDSNLRTPLESQIVSQSAVDGKTWIAHLDTASLDRRRELESRSVKLIECPASGAGKVDLKALMSLLGTRGDVLTVLIEGGGTLIASALNSGLVDRYIATIAPILIGGEDARSSIGGEGLARSMSDALKLKSWKFRRSGADLVIDALLSA